MSLNREEARQLQNLRSIACAAAYKHGQSYGDIAKRIGLSRSRAQQLVNQS